MPEDRNYGAVENSKTIPEENTRRNLSGNTEEKRRRIGKYVKMGEGLFRKDLFFCSLDLI